MANFNDQVIAEFRQNGGNVVQHGGFGRMLVLLHTIGARSGAERVTPTLGLRDGDQWLIAASAAGAPKDPAWAHNLRANPAVTIEHATNDGTETIDVTAIELDGAAYDAAWKRFTDQSEAFADYQRKAGERRIPVFALQP